MRGKSGIVWVSAGVILVAALAAIGAASERRGEPDREPSAPRLTPRGSAADLPPDRPEGDAGAPPQIQPATGGDEGAEAPAERAAAPGCEHPFVPSRPGQWRRYAWHQSGGEEHAAELRIEALSVREIEGGEREITWRVEVTASGDHAQLLRQEMTTRCVPARDAEEPWFGIIERSQGLVPTGEPRWRWPARLREGVRFGGSATYDTSGAAMRRPDGVQGPVALRVTRRHVVGVRERVEVPAGDFRAWRVELEQRYAFGERGESGTGTVWVAPEIGLVKSTTENAAGVRQTIALVAFGPRAAR